MKLASCMILSSPMDPTSPPCKVVAFPGREFDDRNYLSSMGGCCAGVSELSTDEAVSYIMAEAITYMVQGLDAKQIHEELLKIDEYREFWVGTDEAMLGGVGAKSL